MSSRLFLTTKQRVESKQHNEGIEATIAIIRR